MHTRLSARVALAAGTVALALGIAEPVHSATGTAVDCTTNPNALAVALATASDGDTLAIQGTCEGTFEIAHSLTLAGSGGATLDGQEAGTVLTIDSGMTVAVNDLKITGGSGAVAGGINNSGSLALTRSVVSGNAATIVDQFQSGAGGILNAGGSVVLTTSTVSGNSAGTSAIDNNVVGGVLSQGGSVTLADSTVSGNDASGEVEDSVTGGIVNSAGGTLAVMGSTVSGNSGSALGESSVFGGVLNSASNATLTNSTVSGNGASDPGDFVATTGGIGNYGPASLSLTSVTLSGNSASEQNEEFLPPVGGVGTGFGSTLTVENSLFAGESGGPNCLVNGDGSITDAGYNLDDGTSCGFTAATSLSNTNPMLDPSGLQDNGGPTLTIALQSGSPAIDAIPVGANGCGTTLRIDQRGVARPQGAGCDIGAFESLPPAADLSITKSGAPNPVVSGNRLTYTLIVTDLGPGSATGVTVTDPLPSKVHFNSVSSTQGSCTRSATGPKGGTVTCNVGALGSGASASITIVVTTTTPGTLSNTATAREDEPDPNQLNNNATATTTVIGT